MTEKQRREPSTEEQIRAAHVGELVPLVGPIQIVDYDPEWPGLFARETEVLQKYPVQDPFGLLVLYGNEPRVDWDFVKEADLSEPRASGPEDQDKYVFKAENQNWAQFHALNLDPKKGTIELVNYQSKIIHTVSNEPPAEKK